jgi:two-component system response regulator NreC
MTSTPPRLLLVDDHAIVRSGVRRLLVDAGFDVVAEASTAAEALVLAQSESPDAIVLDIGLRDRSGLEILPELVASGARVVILSMQDEPVYARRALEQGAQGYVLKDAADVELADALRAVLAGQLYVQPAMAARLVLGEPEDDLSQRERDVLRLIALGHTNLEIASQLFLSVRTIEAHRRHILTKLRLTTRADLVRYALEHHLVNVA